MNLFSKIKKDSIMTVTPQKTFEINYREAGKNSYYTAIHRRPELGHHEVYTSKSLSYLKNKIWNKGHDLVIRSAK